MTDAMGETDPVAPSRHPTCEVGAATLKGTRLTLAGQASVSRRRLPADGARRTFVLRERDKADRRRFRVEPAAPADDARFAVELELASDGPLPPRPAVWDAYIRFEGGGTRIERRVGASLAALPEAVTMSVRGGPYQVVPYTTKKGNLSFRVAPGSREPRGGRWRQRALRRFLKPAARAGGRVALRVLEARDRRRARRRAVAPSTTEVHILLLHAYGMGGTIRTVHNLAGYLSRNHDVTLYSVVRKAREPFFPFPEGIRVAALDDRIDRPGGLRGVLRGGLSRLPSVLMHMDGGAYKTSSLWTDVQVLRTIRELRSGVVVTTRPALNLLAAMFAPPEVVTVGQEHMNFATHRPALRKAIRRNYGKLDALAVLTETDRASYQEVLSSASTRLVRIPNAVPILDGGTADASNNAVVAAGRLGNQKGFDMLIRAFAAVKARHPDWRLRIYGSGQWRDRLQGMIANYGLTGHVALMGRAPNMGEEFARGSIFALSSRFEGFPMVLIEAMSKGLPVVAFDCPTGPAELVVTGENGVLVERGDVDGFAAALNDLVEDGDKRETCAVGARKTARDYELDVVCAQWDDLFNELAAARGPRA